jgi:hypothetical protein
VDSSGTGVCTLWYGGPQALLGVEVTTYSSYGGNFVHKYQTLIR